MARPSTITIVALSFLVLSLAYFAQSYVSPLGPAPHLGVGLQLSVILSTLVNYVQAAVYAPFANQQIPLSPQQPKQKVDADNSEVIIDEPRPRFTRRIVAVGDIHGDIENAARVLQMAGVVDEDGNWSGNIDVFVQTGDIIDRSLCRYSLLTQLTFPLEVTTPSSSSNGCKILENKHTVSGVR